MNLEKRFLNRSWAETKDLILVDLTDCIRGCDKFEYFGVKIDKENREGN